MNLSSPSGLFALISVIFGAGAMAALLTQFGPFRQRRRQVADFSLGVTMIGSMVTGAGAVRALLDPGGWLTERLWQMSPIGIPYVPQLVIQLRVDPLSAFFMLLTAGFAVVVAVYSFGALRAPHYALQCASIAGAFSVFVWSTLAVLMVNDLFSLLAALELMTLAFAFLTLYKHIYYTLDGPVAHPDWYHQPDAAALRDSRLAPQIYLIVSHTSTAFLIIAALLLALTAESTSFDALRAYSSRVTPLMSDAIFLCALAGLGIRAGLTPAHFWVSLVHPASPTTTHAFSLGIAIKVAIYLMCRFFFQFLTPHPWWGYLLLAVAVITAVFNVWYAIASHDLKKALAYHSIENIGIIAAGLGVALIFAARTEPIAAWISGLALVASLFHLLNHAVFKGLLYLATGAVDDRTGQEVDIERLGGLIRLWPWTAASFIVGALAISGFPPFNGFISEWLTLQALLDGIAVMPGGEAAGAIGLAVALLLLVVSFALTAFCFLKIVGVAFLGQYRASKSVVDHWKAHSPRDVKRPMIVTMALMAVLCLALGLAPAGALPILSKAAGTTLGHEVNVGVTDLGGIALNQAAPRPTAAGEARTPPAWLDARSRITPLPWLALGLLAGGLALLITRLARHARRVAEPWNCGTPYNTGEAQYSPAALSFLIRDAVGAGIERSPSPAARNYLPNHLEMSSGAARGDPQSTQAVQEVFRTVYNHLIRGLLDASAKTSEAWQNGDLGRYLLYILIMNLAVLLLFLLLPR